MYRIFVGTPEEEKSNQIFIIIRIIETIGMEKGNIDLFQ
jgi:hypothetical protein